jgi:Translation initiation factor IF-3, C-terminal domain
VTVQFRGREVSHAYIGRDLLDRFAAAVAEHGNVDRPPVLEGRSMTMVLTSNVKPGAQVRRVDGEPKTESDEKVAPPEAVPPVVTPGSDGPAATRTGG